MRCIGRDFRLHSRDFCYRFWVRTCFCGFANPFFSKGDGLRWYLLSMLLGQVTSLRSACFLLIYFFSLASAFMLNIAFCIELRVQLSGVFRRLLFFGVFMGWYERPDYNRAV